MRSHLAITLLSYAFCAGALAQEPQPAPAASEDASPAEPVRTGEAPTPSAKPEAAAPAAQAQEGAELEALRARNEELERRLDALEQKADEAEVSALLDASGDDIASLAEVEPFRVYGFFDTGVNRAWVPKSSFLHGLVPTDAYTFVFGNLNLYLDFHPGPQWQVLTEIRFTGYPHGIETGFATALGDEYTRISTRVLDSSSPATASSFNYGTIVIERAWAQWTYSEQLQVRVGQFLTPYGIWNVDHGTPTLISLMPPHFQSAEVLPTRQLGMQLLGSVLSSPWELGYHLYVSNGRTATQLDFSDDKAVGGRVRASLLRPLPMTIGASFYYGQIDDVEKSIVSFDPFRIDTEFVVEGTELAFAGDASLDIDALRLRAEVVAKSTRYAEGKRPPVLYAQPGSREPDSNEYDSYLLAAYRLPWLGLEPFVYGEYNHVVSQWGDDQALLSAGLNIHFSPFAQLKTQVARALFFDFDDEGDFSDSDMTLLFSRLVVAF